VDDPTRILRAVRYEQRYDFNLDSRTKDLLMEAKELLNRVSGDRIRHELDRIFEEENAAEMLERLNELSILSAIHPDLAWDASHESLVNCLPGKEIPAEWNVEQDSSGLELNRAICYTIWLMNIPSCQAICDRLRLISPLTGVIEQAADLLKQLPVLASLPPSQITRKLDNIPNLAIYAVYLDLKKPEFKGILSRYLSSWQYIECNVTGKDLQESGLEPGPRYSEILSTIRNAWLDGEIKTKKDEKKLLKELLTEESS
jgi:tRNA nucleotidyltransferase (CCA-adding enzyme)